MPEKAQASLLLEFAFSGDLVDRVGEDPDHPWTNLAIGDPVEFSFVIDAEQPDQWRSPTYGIYDVSSARLTFGSVGFDLPADLKLTVNTFTPNGTQTAEIRFDGLVPGYPDDNGAFQLRGFDVFDDDSIPIDYDLDDFTLNHGVGYGDGTSMVLVSEFHEYSYRVIPSPAAFWLATAIALPRRRRRQRRVWLPRFRRNK